MIALVLTGCSLGRPWDRGLPVPVYTKKIEEPKIESKFQSASVIYGRVVWKWDREADKDVQLRDNQGGFAKDIWHGYFLEVFMDFGDHEERVELRVSKEVFEKIRELSDVKVKRSLYDDGSRSYELVIKK